jgi:hypothetical protein
MSDEEKGFLARWSQRKREAAKAEPQPTEADKPEQQAAEPSTASGDAELPFDLESLPKLEELTKDTDMTVFFRKGVPESIRNAALRKAWALDPAIRNYVNPALDYAYDWNTPGGVPGAGELAPGTDIARMVAQVFGEQPQTVDKSVENNEAADDAPAKVRQADASAPSIRLSDASAKTSAEPEQQTETDASPQEAGRPRDDTYGERPSFASQQESRKHGSARPK